jgi:hypothetical protein
MVLWIIPNISWYSVLMYVMNEIGLESDIETPNIKFSVQRKL